MHLSPQNFTRKRLARLAQEREYSKLIDSANAPIFGVDNKGQVNVWNQCAMRLVGYSPEEVMGHSLVEEFITKDYQASVQMVLDQALKGKETANFEFPLMTKAGIRLDVLLNATTRRDEQGNVIGVVGIGQDITGKCADGENTMVAWICYDSHLNYALQLANTSIQFIHTRFFCNLQDVLLRRENTLN